MINSNETSPDETWTCEVTPNDGIDDGSTQSDSVTISKRVPTFSYESPSNNSENVSVDYTNLMNITITDGDGETFDWTIETYPNIGSNSSNDDTNGSKNCTISGLTSGTTYTWYVNATDGTDWTNETFTFTCNNKPSQASPTISPDPAYRDNDITCTNGTSTDSDGHTVSSIFSWQVDGEPVCLLNMPFDTNISSSDTGWIRDYSGHENNGTLSSPPNIPDWNTSGKVNAGFTFENKGFVRIPKSDSLNATYNMTFEFWIKPDCSDNGIIFNSIADGTTPGPGEIIMSVSYTHLTLPTN